MENTMNEIYEMLQSIDCTLKHIEEILLTDTCRCANVDVGEVENTIISMLDTSFERAKEDINTGGC